MAGNFERDLLECTVKSLELKTSKQSETANFFSGALDRTRAVLKNYKAKQFNIDKLNICQLIGEGSFGLVWKCSINGKEAALKQSKGGRKQIPEDLLSERNLMLEIQHPHIVRLLGCLCDGDIFFLYELCSGDTGAYYHTIPKQHLEGMIIQLLSAVSFLHEKDIIHCDIKPGNVLIASNNAIKLADFGSAVKLIPRQEKIFSKSHKGTFCYSSLESLERKEYSKKSDMYSIGATVFEWDTKKPLKFPRYNCSEDNLDYYLRVHKQGRPIEAFKENVWTVVRNNEDIIQTEKLTDRIKKSHLSALLEIVCSDEENIRPIPCKLTTLQVFKKSFDRIRELAAKEDHVDIISDNGKQQADILLEKMQKFKKSSYNPATSITLLGFYYEDPELFENSEECTFKESFIGSTQTLEKCTQFGSPIKQTLSKQTQCSNTLVEKEAQNVITPLKKISLTEKEVDFTLHKALPTLVPVNGLLECSNMPASDGRKDVPFEGFKKDENRDLASSDVTISLKKTKNEIEECKQKRKKKSVIYSSTDTEEQDKRDPEIESNDRPHGSPSNSTLPQERMKRLQRKRVAPTIPSSYESSPNCKTQRRQRIIEGSNSKKSRNQFNCGSKYTRSSEKTTKQKQKARKKRLHKKLERVEKFETDSNSSAVSLSPQAPDESLSTSSSLSVTTSPSWNPGNRTFQGRNEKVKPMLARRSKYHTSVNLVKRSSSTETIDHPQNLNDDHGVTSKPMKRPISKSNSRNIENASSSSDTDSSENFEDPIDKGDTSSSSTNSSTRYPTHPSKTVALGITDSRIFKPFQRKTKYDRANRKGTGNKSTELVCRGKRKKPEFYTKDPVKTDDKYPCQFAFCRKIFKSEATRKRHEDEHFIRHECTICDKSYVRKESLIQHIITEHDEFAKPRLCPWCRKPCKNVNRYNYHMRICNKNPAVVVDRKQGRKKK